ncbi:bacterio-opsin activator domain-containing protein [Salinigranum salinum]|uniref:bacterio-opsin activator domain-containing protein n=1 Tax=Salinigranum salinum TaxID=1364937 RepID=UPI0012605A5D|nr:bacterio-opsin activator domain-containing protein [Salinigranum salinum]
MEDERTDDAIERFVRAAAGEPVTASEVAEAVGCVRRTAHKHLTRLADGGAVETKKVGSRARVWWSADAQPSDGVFGRITDAFFAVDTDWEFTYLNDQAEQLLGQTADALVGRTLWEAFPDAVDTAFESEYRRAMETQDAVSFEERYPPLETTFAVEAYPSPTGLSVYFRDVTDRVRRERELHARVHQQRTVARLGRRALTATDVDEFMTHVCEVVSEILDTAYSKVLELDAGTRRLHLRAGVGWDDGVVGTATVPADANSQAGYTLQRREPVRVEALSTERRFTGPDLLTDHGVESGVSVVIGSPGEPWGILGTHDTAARSFTEQDADFVQSVATLLASAVDRHEHERELARYETVFEALSDGVYAVDSDGRFTLVNEAYVRMTGVPREELVGSHVSRLVDEDVRAAAKGLEGELVSGRRETATLEAELTDASGETFPAEATFSIQESADGYERIGVVRDTTERRRHEEAIQEQRDRFERVTDTALRVFDAIRGVIRAETRADIEQTVCDRLVDGGPYRGAAVGPVNWDDDRVTTSVGDEWPSDAWQGVVPPLIAEATEHERGVAVEADTVAVELTYDERQFGLLVLRTERDDGFDERERSLLVELGSAVGLGISAVERKDVLVNDSVTTLEFGSTALAEPFTDVVGADASFEFLADRIVPVGDDTYVSHYSVGGISPEAFVEATESFPTVERARVLDSHDGGRRVELQTTGGALVTQFRRFDGRVRSFTLDDRELQCTVDVPPGNVREIVETVTATYPDLELRAQRTNDRRVRTSATFHSAVEDRLTERQRTALELAYFGGYFEWPRTTDGEALSTTMGITPPTFHKHLRLAERKVLDALYREPEG